MTAQFGPRHLANHSFPFICLPFLVVMDNIWKNTVKKQRTRDRRNTTVKLTITTPVRTANTLPVTATTTPKWCDPETMTLEQIDEKTRRLLREWPKDNGTPFPMEILEVLRDLKLMVRARDAANSSMTVSVTTNTDIADATSTPTRVEQTTTELIKAFELNTAAPAPIPTAAPSTSSDAYTTAWPEQLYSLLTAAPSTVTNGTSDLWETAPDPADYSLADIEQVLAKVRKRHRRTGTPVPKSIHENARLLMQAVQA
jgi:hypothetical protein